MSILLPTQSTVLNAYAVLIGSTPGNTAFTHHQDYIKANGIPAYTATLSSIFAGYSNAQLGNMMLTNLGLGGVFSQAEAETFLAAYASDRVGAMINVSNMLLNYVGGDAALLAAQASYAARIEASHAYSSNPDNVATIDLVTLMTPVTHFMLTSSSDNITGTAGDDFFDAPLVQSSLIGGVSNSLSTADRIDGGAGWDTLHAELVEEFFGMDADDEVDVQPRINNVEEIKLEVVSFDADEVTVDAKNIRDVVKIGSHYSDGDLVIANLTTKTSAGGVRNTDAITITMDHTDNFNSDEDASDLTVLFDDNYLLSGQQSEFTLELRIVNAYQLAEVNAPLVGFLAVTFTAGAQEVTVDISSANTYAQVINLINADLVSLGIDASAVALPLRNAVFTDDIGPYLQGQLAGQYTPIQLVSSTLALSPGPILLDSNVQNFDGLNTWTNPTSSTSVNPVAINVELHKVGRGDDGGDLIIGAKSYSQGIPVMHVDVLGNASKPSNLGQIDTTADALNQIFISTHADYVGGNSYASLTIRNNFNSTPTLVNANAFLGDLTMGSLSDFTNIRTMTATGGGDVTYWAAVGTPPLASMGNLAYTATTAGGSDFINVDVDGGAQMTVTTGAGNDTVVSDVNGATASGSTQSSITVNSASGNNTVILSSTGTNNAFVTTGGGVDMVTGGGTDLTASTGAGNDVIYAENTGSKAVAVKVAYTQSTTDLDGSAASTYAVEDYKLLAGRDIRVTLAIPGDADEFVNGFETVVTVAGTKGTISTLAAYNTAVLNAINNHPVLKNLAVATVDSNNVITVTYIVDGEFVTLDEAVQVEVLGTTADALTAPQLASLLGALRAEYSDSGITEASVIAAFDAVADSAAIIGATTGSNSSTSGENTINAGLGDDIVVLSSDAATVDAVVFDAGPIGNDTIVHFNDGVGGDILDFTAWMNLNYSFSGSLGSVSERRVETTVELDTTIDAMSTDAGRNIVSVIDFTDLTVPGALTVTTFAQLLALSNTNMALLMNETFDTTAAGSNSTKHIILVQNFEGSVNFETPNEGNLGQYAVIQAETSASSDVLTNVQLIGTLDFGNTQSFDISNFA